MARLTMNVLQERGQLFTEFLIIVGAAEPAGIAKLDELDTANGALTLVEEIRFLALFKCSPLSLLNRSCLLRLIEELMVTLFAQVEFFVMFVAYHLGNVVGSRLSTLMALQH